MKGISPLIATILLIAFTVAVGGLLSVWFSSLTTSQTQTVQAGSDALANCATTSLSITDVRYVASGSSRIVNVTIASSGNQNLKNLTFVIAGGGAVTNSIKYYNSSGDDFTPGSIFATSIDTTGGASVPPELVSVSAICQGRLSKETTCKAGESCMKPV